MQNINFGNAEPRIALIRDRYRKAVDLAMEKVAGHFQQPQQYPLSSDKSSLEYVVHDLLSAVKKHRRDKFIDKHSAHLSDSASKRQQTYGDLSAVNLHAVASVTEQVKNLPVSNDKKMSKEEADVIVGIIRQHAVMKTGVGKSVKAVLGAPRAAVVASRVSFSVDSLICNKVSEIRKDEINIGGFAIDSVGLQQAKAVFFVGDFKKGDSLPLGANSKFFDLAINGDPLVGGFPQVFSAALFLVEKDWIHNAELAEKLAKVCLALWGVFTAVGAVIMGAVIMTVAGGPVALVIGLIALTLGGIFLTLGIMVLPIIADDVSSIGTDTLILDAFPNIGDAFTRRIEFELENSLGDRTSGQYTASVRWVAER